MRIIIFILSFQVVSSAVSQTANPFSIDRAEVISDMPEEAVVPVEETPATKIEGDNPFNVSHIPIRKNQYEEIKRLTQTERAVEENISLTSLPLWMIITSLCGLALLIYQRKDHLSMLVRSITNENFMRMTNLDENGGFSFHYIIGYLVYLLNIALFIYLLITKYFSKNSELISQPIEGGWQLFIKLLGLTALFFLGKHIANRFFGWVFNVPKEARLYDFTIISIYNLIGIFVLFLNILLVFGPGAWMRGLAIMGVTIFIIFLLSRHYRGIRIGRQLVNNYFFHFFLYFCAFEISPWVVIYTLTKDFI